MSQKGPKILLLDIETAPHKGYFWGLFNQNLSIDKIEEPGYTLCWAAKWHKQSPMLFSSRHASGVENMIARAHELLDEADAVVTYNGNRFDLPILNQEFLLQGLGPPAPYKTIDLYTTVRREFRLASNKLDYVANYLGLGTKIKHKGMELWKECMQGKDSSWNILERYNKRDVSLLEKVYNKLLPWIRVHPNYALYTDDTRPVCTHCGSHHLQKRGLAYTTTMTYQQWHCQNCGKWMRERKNNTPKEKKEVTLR